MADRRNQAGEPNIQPKPSLHLLALEKHQMMRKVDGAGNQSPIVGIVFFLFPWRTDSKAVPDTLLSNRERVLY